ncbi:MAG: membrane protein insertion efficiency factor YidD [Acidobacteriota bacterium]|nr:membrane protein insertion efficiency factor YidD [Acidobacteriota bacterium]
MIRLYQIHVSPRKGFSCPHRELHGELSCSSYVSRLLQLESSLPAVVSKSCKRFQDCAGASTQLASQSPRMKCWVVPCCLPL